MLVFNIRRVLGLRNILNGIDHLTRNGFTRPSALNIYKFQISNIKIRNLEKLCRLFNCTPNDFFEWQPVETEEPIAETHALNSLRRTKSAEITKLIKEIPLEKLGDVEEFLKELKVKN